METEQLLKILSEEREKTLEATKKLINEALARHEKAERHMHREALKKIEGVLTEEHSEEHSFVRSWMHRMDNMGEGFFSSIGKSLAWGVLLVLGALALVTLGGNTSQILPK